MSAYKCPLTGKQEDCEDSSICCEICAPTPIAQVPALQEASGSGVLSVPDGATVHELKVWSEFYQAIACGLKPFEWRKDDRGFEVGHWLHLRDYDKESGLYTGDSCYRLVTYVLRGAFGVPEGFCVLGLGSLPPGEAESVPSLLARIAELEGALRMIQDKSDSWLHDNLKLADGATNLIAEFWNVAEAALNPKEGGA